MQENMFKNEALWNFRCRQGKIPPRPPDKVMLGIIPVTTEHLQRLVWLLKAERAQCLARLDLS